MALDKKLCSLIDNISYGAVIGPEGFPWAETPGFMPIESELSELLKAFSYSTLQLQKGLSFQKAHFMVIHQEPNTIVAQNQNGMLVLCQCVSCLVVTYLECDFIEDDCIKVTQDLAKWIDATPINEL